MFQYVTNLLPSPPRLWLRTSWKIHHAQWHFPFIYLKWIFLSSFSIPDSGFRNPDSGFWFPDSGFRVAPSSRGRKSSLVEFPLGVWSFRFHARWIKCFQHGMTGQDFIRLQHRDEIRTSHVKHFPVAMSSVQNRLIKKLLSYPKTAQSPPPLVLYFTYRQ